MTPLPIESGQSPAADIGGPLPGSKYLFIVADDYSRFYLVGTVKSLTAKTVNFKLQHIFSVYGIPKLLSTQWPPLFSR